MKIYSYLNFKIIMTELIKRGSPEWLKIISKLIKAGGESAKNAAQALLSWHQEKTKPTDSSNS